MKKQETEKQIEDCKFKIGPREPDIPLLTAASAKPVRVSTSVQLDKRTNLQFPFILPPSSFTPLAPLASWR